ncbi:3-deoxy-7-phosphoheptulonate synthase [Thermomonospora cellulosilytica]|uniref:3-deoxy-7-phosphoheptulonate synthase n=1 Tax=Thermomonospora cellulosilytica TaxID=1411118 RepID=UPI0015F7F335|nr:3-deoxy-7-phosphoheptulonate synthase [Thermomonospora cellulosilytica]
MQEFLPDVRSRPALQQPGWAADPRLAQVRRELAHSAPLVRPEDVRRLRSLLARVAAGRAQVVLAGDCAEDPAECGAGDVARKAGLLDLLAGTLKMITRRPVLRAGRIAGQFAKPRSRPTERVGDLELPAYRGHMVNAPEPDPELRRPDPRRMLAGYRSAAAVMRHLGWTRRARRWDADTAVWTSHEALLLDYELPLLRPAGSGGVLLSSTHWPWVGERTRGLDGAHIALLAGVVNPVACKVGPSMTPAELLELCARLDPGREPGRLTLVARMGADRVADLLPPLVEAVRAAGHPVIWLTDPMHGNTVTTPAGLKTRFVERMAEEVRAFQAAVQAAGGVAGGLHLETTPDDVTECVPNQAHVDRVGDKYTTFCDPRLNPGQAVSVVSAWCG